MATTQGSLPFEPERFYSISEAAAYLHISKSKMYQIVRDRQIRYIKTGKEIMFRQEFLDEYIKSRIFDVIPPDPGINDHVR